MPQQFLRDLRVNARIVQYGSIFVPQRVAVYVAGPHSTPRFAAPFLVLVGQPMRPAEPFPAFIQSGFADRGSAAYEIISGKMRAALCKDFAEWHQKWYDAHAFLCFRGRYYGPIRIINNSFCYRDCARVKVDILPLEGQGFTAAHAGI